MFLPILVYNCRMSKKMELLTAQAAADRLKLSTRRLADLAAEGKLTRHRAYDPETKREAGMFDAAEIEAFLERRRYEAAGVPVAPAPGALVVQSRRLPIEGELDMDADWNASMAGVGRLWLTLAEAAEYSGLPASHLLELIGERVLKARDVGVRPGGRLRVRRLDIDAIEGVDVAL
jgi:excisionase family DNA binding protein